MECDLIPSLQRVRGVGVPSVLGSRDGTISRQWIWILEVMNVVNVKGRGGRRGGGGVVTAGPPEINVGTRRLFARLEHATRTHTVLSITLNSAARGLSGAVASESSWMVVCLDEEEEFEKNFVACSRFSSRRGVREPAAIKGVKSQRMFVRSHPEKEKSSGEKLSIKGMWDM